MSRKIRLPKLHPAQETIWRNATQFAVISAGRRFGKNLLVTNQLLKVAQPGGMTWFVTLDYSHTEYQWRLLKRLAKQLPDAEFRETIPQTIRFDSGGFIQLRSADTDLRGVGLDFIALDEFAHWQRAMDKWQEDLAPTLLDRNGAAWFISTPKGRNAFYDLYTRGLDPLHPDWSSFHFPSTANPFLSAEALQSLTANMSELTYKQEILAEFIETGGLVFRSAREVCVLDPLPAREEGAVYVAGVDWGRTNDHTVIAVFDRKTQRMVAMDRFSKIGYELQLARLKLMYERWRPERIIAESNAMGGPLVERLSKDGLPIKGYTMTAPSKAELIESLVVGIERGALNEKHGCLLLNNPVLIAELEAFEQRELPSGRYQYGAPPGSMNHDDCVIAVALAWSEAKRGLMARAPRTLLDWGPPVNPRKRWGY